MALHHHAAARKSFSEGACHSEPTQAAAGSIPSSKNSRRIPRPCERVQQGRVGLPPPLHIETNNPAIECNCLSRANRRVRISRRWRRHPVATQARNRESADKPPRI